METRLECILTNAYKAELITWLAAHPEEFEEIIKLSLTDKQPYSWRAAWLLWSCIEKNDPRIEPYIKNIIDFLPNINDDHQREFLIILQKMDIPEEYEGVLFDHCANVWGMTNKKPSVRMNAFKMLVKIAGNHPELQQELLLLTQRKYTESLSAAAIKSIDLLSGGFKASLL